MRDFFKKNLGLKLLSLIIAISLEFYFLNPQNLAVETVNFPIDIQGLSDDYTIVWPPTVEDGGLMASCKIRGPGPLVQEVQAAPKKIIVALPAHPSETFITPLSAVSLKLPAGVELLDLQPKMLELHIEPVIERQLDVRPMTTGEVIKGYRLNAIQVIPDKVVVRGPKGEVGPLVALETEEIDIGELNAPAAVEVALKSRDRQIKLKRRTVRAEINIGPILQELSLSNVRVDVKAPDGYAATVSPSRVKVTLAGNAEALKAVASGSVEVGADLGNLTNKTSAKIVEKVGLVASDLPDGVSLVSTLPPQVEVKLVKRVSR